MNPKLRAFLAVWRGSGVRTALATTVNFFRDRLIRLTLVPRLRRMIPLGGQNLNDDDLLEALRCLPTQVLAYKTLGYDLARQLASTNATTRIEVPPSQGLSSKACTQADMESAWFVWWCQELKIMPIYHRKLWEYAFALQVIHDHGLLRQEARGIGFGCGEEPLASYFASRGVCVTVTDQPLESSIGWRETGQHAASLGQSFRPELVTREVFLDRVEHRAVDMNQIPDFAEPFDFCWSLCAMEHLGSIESGLCFVECAMKVLKPGGVAVFTTEFNYLSPEATIDHRQTVLFRHRDLVELGRRLGHAGHEMLSADFDVGSAPLDRFVDLPPYSSAGPGAAHLKLGVRGFAVTCFGIVVRKGREA